MCNDGYELDNFNSKDIDLFGNIIVKLINIKLFVLLICCHYILNPFVCMYRNLFISVNYNLFQKITETDSLLRRTLHMFQKLRTVIRFDDSEVLKS